MPKTMIKKKPAKKPASSVKKAAPAPSKTEKLKKVTAADLVEVGETSFVLAVDLKRHPDASIYEREIEQDQKFFPYAIVSRLLVGWQSVNFISSLEFKLTPDYPLPRVIVRFSENLTPEEVKAMDPALRSQVEAQIGIVRQYPFVTVESPLLTK